MESPGSQSQSQSITFFWLLGSSSWTLTLAKSFYPRIITVKQHQGIPTENSCSVVLVETKSAKSI